MKLRVFLLSVSIAVSSGGFQGVARGPREEVEPAAAKSSEHSKQVTD